MLFKNVEQITEQSSLQWLAARVGCNPSMLGTQD